MRPVQLELDLRDGGAVGDWRRKRWPLVIAAAREIVARAERECWAQRLWNFSLVAGNFAVRR